MNLSANCLLNTIFEHTYALSLLSAEAHKLKSSAGDILNLVGYITAKANLYRPVVTRFVFMSTNFSICPTHRSANASSVNRAAEARALRLIARHSSGGSVRAFMNAWAYSEIVVAWNPVSVSHVPYDFGKVLEDSPVGPSS